MQEKLSFKERVRQALISCSRSYMSYFVAFEYLLLSRGFKEKPYYIVASDEGNYLHLTGVISHLSAEEFFKKCYCGSIELKDFDVDGRNGLKGIVRRKRGANLFDEIIVGDEGIIFEEYDSIKCLLSKTIIDKVRICYRIAEIIRYIRQDSWKLSEEKYD